MTKKNFLRAVLILCAAMCTAFAFSVCGKAVNGAAPAAVQPDAVSIEELHIVANYAVLEGETIQMQIEEFDEFVLFDSVKWTSSNPEVVYCSKSGEIKGLKEGKATITVEANIGDATDSITVYCARKLSNSYSSRIANPFAWSCQTPMIFNFQTIHFNVYPILMTGKLNVKGVYGSYFYIEFARSEKTYKGFILQSWMPSDIASDEIFRELSTYDLNVYVGQEKEEYKVTTNYKGNVKWTVSEKDKETIHFDDKTGKVKGLKGGTATISATVGEKTLKCTVHSIYLWPLKWTGAAKQTTYVYKAKGDSYEKTSTELAVGDRFTVKGDMGGNSSWAYGVSESGTEGFIPISHISTKNTISYYNGLNWRWPLENLEYNYVNSPHAPRPDPELNDEHRGFDINKKDNQTDIEGQKIVAAFDGVVKYIGADLSKDDGCGYYICITSKTVDPVTGKKIIATYQHMQGWARFSEKEEVKKGDWIGNVGNTGRSFGSHLHFEVNNWYAGIGDPGRSDFTYTINPIYFYMDMVKNNELIMNLECTAVEYGYSFYFYNYNADEEK